MEALSLPINTLTNSSAKQHIYLSASSNYASLSSSLQLNPSLPTRPLTLRKSAVRVQAENEDFELKQMRDMAAARKRWEALIRDGKIKVLTPREAGYAVQLSNKPLLDVRPSNEHKKAWVRASTWIPIFDVDNKLDFGTIPRKVTSFVMGGWWSGMPTLSYDSWTDQQRAAAAKEGWGYRLVFSARLIGLILVVDALYIGAQQIGRYLQDIRTH
ncbi:hypothetical protein JHK86_015594 [Glycine max]|nr:hypothetical protein JHK86_015594 [Glycine max]